MYSVLLVDDCSADIAGLIKNVNWDTLNCSVVATASNGVDGIEKAAKLKPDIIITDVSMPEADGITMTKQIKKFMPHVSFIFISCFDEFSYIKSAMDENVSAYVLKPIKIDELTKAIKKVTSSPERTSSYTKLIRHVGTLAENFLSDLLFTSEFDAEYAMLLGIPFHERFRLALMQYSDEQGSQSTQIYKMLSSLKGICSENASEKQNYFLEFGVNSLVLFIHESSMTEEEFKEYLKNVMEAAPSPLRLKCSYEPKPSALDEICDVFLRLSSEEKSKSNLMSPGELYEKLSRAIFSESSEDIPRLTDTMLNQISLDDINYTKTLSVQIISTLTLILNEHNAGFSDIFDDEFIIWNKLFNFKSIVNIRQLIINLMMSVREFLTEKNIRSDKYEQIAMNIKSFIDRNFPSPTIVEDVALYVHLSVNHTNSIFKKVTGQTLFNYTVSRRIERAKLLMSDKSLSISDIAMAVGYVNNAHFATAFKKNTGLSPSQYRNNHGR